MDIQRDNFFPGRVYNDSFMHGKPRDRPREYPRLENGQRLHLPPMPHARFNKISDRTHYRNDMQFGDGSDWSTFPVMKLTKMGWVCDYDGVAMYGNCGNNPSLNITDAITMEAWVNDGGVDKDGDIVRKDFAYIIKNYGGSFDLRYSSIIYADGEYRKVSLGYEAADGLLHHVAGTYNVNTRTLKIYVDGAFMKSRFLSGLNDYNINISSSNLLISSTTAYYNDTIDGVRIYNYAQSAAKTKDGYWRQA